MQGDTGKQRGPVVSRASPRTCSRGSDLGDVRRLQALRAFPNFEFDVVVFLQRPEPVCLDGRVVDEHIGSPFTLDEPEALCVVEPLDPAGDAGHTLRAPSTEPGLVRSLTASPSGASREILKNRADYISRPAGRQHWKNAPLTAYDRAN